MNNPIISKFEIYVPENEKAAVDLSDILPKLPSADESNIEVTLKVLYLGQVKVNESWTTIYRVLVMK